MPSMRYSMDVHGWEPGYDGGTSPSTFGVSPSFGIPPETMNSHLSSRRQAPSTRARAATCPDIYDFTFMPRPELSPLQRKTSMSASAYSATTESYVSSSARNAAAAGRSGSRPRSSTERKIARKLAENANYVPRPKNSFILFRTDFVAQKTAAGAHSDASSLDSSHRSSKDGKSGDDEEDTNQSLSKQASEVWNKMTDEDKKPWVERAKLEKAAHEAKYPHYRYKPVRQSSARKNLLPPGSSKASLSPPRRPSLCLQRTSSEFPTIPTPAQATNEEDEIMSPTSATDANNQFITAYQSPVASSSAMTLDATLQMPAPLRKLSLPPASPSSSALANALGSQSSTPAVQDQITGPALPTVPPVPTLTLSRAGPSRTTGLPLIPRSPSAPIFDRHVVGQFPYQQRQQFVPPSYGFPQTQNMYLSAPSANIGASPSFSPSAPHMPVLNASETSTDAQATTSPPPSSTSGSDMTMQSTLSDSTDYFHEFVHSDDMTAGPAPTPLSLSNQQLFTNNENDYEKCSDNYTHHELDEMDIDMRALLNLSPLPEVAELGTTDVRRPFDAIAALWMLDQQRASDGVTESTSEARTEPDPQATSQNALRMQTSPKVLQSVFPSPKSVPSSDRESGLDTYSLAVDGDYFNTCAANTCLEDDLLRLDLDFRPTSRFGCAADSTLSLSAFDGAEDLVNNPGDAFGYDREHGLYGFGSGFGTGVDYGF